VSGGVPLNVIGGFGVRRGDEHTDSGALTVTGVNDALYFASQIDRDCALGHIF
jgi:hypothetical protein